MGQHMTDGIDRRTSGLCTEQGTRCPEGAQVAELIWNRSGMPSGGKAWDLLLLKRRPAAPRTVEFYKKPLA